MNKLEIKHTIKTLHSKPFISSIDCAIQRESRIPNQRIRDQFRFIQNILFEELRNLANRLPSNEELDYITVKNDSLQQEAKIIFFYLR